MARVPASEFQRESGRLRGIAMPVGNLGDEELAALDAVEIPVEAARYNQELS